MTVLRRLVRYHKHLLDEKRRVLRELEERSAAIADGIATLESGIVSEQRAASRSADASSAYGGFVRASLDRREELAEELLEANAVVEAARDELVEMFADVKRYEISLENQERKERREEDRRIQDSLDEASLNMYRRSGSSKNWRIS
jgi:flagellar FliJ protein